MTVNQAYLDFIKYSIGPDTELPISMKDIEWKSYLKYCNRQGVVGIVFDGLQRSDFHIPQTALFEWISFNELIKAQNQIVNQRLNQITDYFEEKNVRCCILKGQANGLMYPQPELRSPGDIDLWVDASDVETIKLVQSEFKNAQYSLHHIKMPIFNDVSIEVHYSPTHLINWKYDKRLQRYINQIKEEQFNNQRQVGSKDVAVLTDEFNLIYQLLHMYGHFITTRNNFKQFVDYYYLLNGTKCDVSRVSSLLKDFGVLRYAKGVMWVMKEILGIKESMLYTDPDRKVGELILNESMRFGLATGSKKKLALQQIIGNIKIATLFPMEFLISPVYLVWHQWWKLKMKFSLKIQ